MRMFSKISVLIIIGSTTFACKARQMNPTSNVASDNGADDNARQRLSIVTASTDALDSGFAKNASAMVAALKAKGLLRNPNIGNSPAGGFGLVDGEGANIASKLYEQVELIIRRAGDVN